MPTVLVLYKCFLSPLPALRFFDSILRGMMRWARFDLLLFLIPLHPRTFSKSHLVFPKGYLRSMFHSVKLLKREERQVNSLTSEVLFNAIILRFFCESHIYVCWRGRPLCFQVYVCMIKEQE